MTFMIIILCFVLPLIEYADVAWNPRSRSRHNELRIRGICSRHRWGTRLLFLPEIWCSSLVYVCFPLVYELIVVVLYIPCKKELHLRWLRLYKMSMKLRIGLLRNRELWLTNVIMEFIYRGIINKVIQVTPEMRSKRIKLDVYIVYPCTKSMVLAIF